METYQLVIVGAGTAGCAAALEAAQLGLSVLLVDEHPQSTDSMGLDAPYFYGARLPAILSDASAVADAVLGSNEPLMECLEAGVDVLTGTCVWGIFGPDAGDPDTRGRQIGLADEERSWIVGYEYLVLAQGARDLVLSFPNWQLPGVLGVKGATALLDRYGVLGGSKLLVLGSGNAGLLLAKKALAAGVGVIGIVDPATTAAGDATLVEELRSSGVAFYVSHTIECAIGTSEVTSARLRLVETNGELSAADPIELPCDTICMAFGTVPNIELASVAGCAIEFDSIRSGWTPRLTADMETSVERIFVVGNSAGVTEDAILRDDNALHQGRTAARAIARQAGGADNLPSEATTDERRVSTFPPDRWLETMIRASGRDVILCQCEEVTRQELLGVTPPRYLRAQGRAPVAALESLSGHGRTSQDLLKRLTRVGMGHCQGRRCRDQGIMMLAKEAGVDISSVTPGSYRIPVRPLSVNLLATTEESPDLRERWSYWLHEAEGGVPQA